MFEKNFELFLSYLTVFGKQNLTVLYTLMEYVINLTPTCAGSFYFIIRWFYVMTIVSSSHKLGMWISSVCTTIQCYTCYLQCRL